MTQHAATTRHDIALSVPRHWVTHADPEQAIALAARAPRRLASGFAPELVLRAVLVSGDPAQWRTRALVAPGSGLEQFEVEEIDDDDEIAGRPVGYRRFGHRVGAVDVICEQWVWVVDGVGVTFTGSVARADYADYADVFESIAATIEVTPVARPGSGHRDEGCS